MLLATDLDGTFLGGKSLHKQTLYRLIRERDDIKLVFVTGRGLESVLPILNDPIIPNPDYIICDVGATIVNGHTLEPVEPLQGLIEQKWPGRLRIEETLAHLTDLDYQEVPQQRRCSFFTANETVIEYVRESVAILECDVIYSAGRFLDVLPQGVNKGSSLQQLISYLGIDETEVLVAGDTLNDLAMYNCGFKGAVVGNAEASLVKAIRGMKQVYYARSAGAGGILEAMSWFHDFVGRYPVQADEIIKEESQGPPQLVMMYHRFPYEKVEKDGQIQRVPPRSPNGILPTLQGFFANGRAGVWIAWEEVNAPGEELRNIYIDKEKYPNLMASRIGLTHEEVEIFYKSFSKEAFWPAIFAFVDKVKFNHDHWEHFVQINQRFADKAAMQADAGAIVWIHDYNLWLVPGMLRQLRPDLTIAFFHHTAFPAANTFNILPWRREIIGSLLQCDYIGFHIPRYVENFVDVVNSLFPSRIREMANCAPRFLTYSAAIGVDRMTTALECGQRIIRLGANPVGIDVEYIREHLQKPSVTQKIEDMRREMKGKKMILSAERLDYVKGPLEKILAFEAFLEAHPEYHAQIELINICTPPADGMKIYDSMRLELEQAVGRINGRYANLDWTPLRVFFRSVPFDEILVYYAVADIAWITPLRDGLNLVAKEYIAAQGQQENKGVLILSEFAGAAVEFPYAVLTNPYDMSSLQSCLLQALQMNDEERTRRMERLYEEVSHFDIHHWASEFLQAVMATRGAATPVHVPAAVADGV